MVRGALARSAPFIRQIRARKAPWRKDRIEVFDEKLSSAVAARYTRRTLSKFGLCKSQFGVSTKCGDAKVNFGAFCFAPRGLLPSCIVIGCPLGFR
jgi:hypothetical protein